MGKGGPGDGLGRLQVFLHRDWATEAFEEGKLCPMPYAMDTLCSQRCKKMYTQDPRRYGNVWNRAPTSGRQEKNTIMGATSVLSERYATACAATIRTVHAQNVRT